MITLISYNAAPRGEIFNEISAGQIEERLRDLQSDPTPPATGWAQSANDSDEHATRLALEASRAGMPVMSAEDEDGFYYAVDAPAGCALLRKTDEFAIALHNGYDGKGEPNAESLDWYLANGYQLAGNGEI